MFYKVLNFNYNLTFIEIEHDQQKSAELALYVIF